MSKKAGQLFRTLKREEDGQKLKILVQCTLGQKYPYSVQVVELYRYNGLPLENKIFSFESLAEAEEFYKKAFDVLTLSACIARAEGILRKLRGKIRAYESTHEDLAPRGWIKAERKIRRWLERAIPQKAAERRDWMDCYL